MPRCTIDKETFEEIEALVTNFNNGVKPSPQMISSWINSICRIGLSALIQNKVDLNKMMIGASPEEWFHDNKVSQRGIFPKPEEERHLKEVTPIAQPELKKEVRERKSKYNPEEYASIRKNLEN